MLRVDVSGSSVTKKVLSCSIYLLRAFGLYWVSYCVSMPWSWI